MWRETLLAYICELLVYAEEKRLSKDIQSAIRKVWGVSDIRLEQLAQLLQMPDDLPDKLADCLKMYIQGDFVGFFSEVEGIDCSSQEGLIARLLAETFAYCYYDQFPAVKYNSLLRAAAIVREMVSGEFLTWEQQFFLLTLALKALGRARHHLPPQLKLDSCYDGTIEDLRQRIEDLRQGIEDLRQRERVAENLSSDSSLEASRKRNQVTSENGRKLLSTAVHFGAMLETPELSLESAVRTRTTKLVERWRDDTKVYRDRIMDLIKQRFQKDGLPTPSVGV